MTSTETTISALQHRNRYVLRWIDVSPSGYNRLRPHDGYGVANVRAMTVEQMKRARSAERKCNRPWGALLQDIELTQQNMRRIRQVCRVLPVEHRQADAPGSASSPASLRGWRMISPALQGSQPEFRRP